MLVLSRREDDKILFPNLGITVQILRVDGQKVRVGVDAPREVKILRHELKENELPDCNSQVSNRSALSGASDVHIKGAAKALTSLYHLCNRDLDSESERLILDVFHHLKAIDEQSNPSKERQSDELDDLCATMSRRSKHALLVEDSMNESRLLAGYLRTKQFDVALASDGQEALDYLELHESPDIVLLDMQMPGMDGATTISRMRADQRHKSLKVFAVSGGNPTDYGVNVGPNGVDGWFPKPLDPEALAFRLALESNETRPEPIPA